MGLALAGTAEARKRRQESGPLTLDLVVSGFCRYVTVASAIRVMAMLASFFFVPLSLLLAFAFSFAFSFHVRNRERPARARLGQGFASLPFLAQVVPHVLLDDILQPPLLLLNISHSIILS